MTFSHDIAKSSEEIATLAMRGTLQRTVPSCPAWTLGDLVYHLGEVQVFWSRNLRAKTPNERLSSTEFDKDPDDDDLIEWFRNCTSSLVDALRTVGNESPCWTWWGEPATSAAVARHQVQEAAIHCWDAQLTLGVARPIDAVVAHDGVGEFLEVHRGSLAVPQGPLVTLRSTDSRGEWRLGSSDVVSCEVSGTASQLVLLLNGRIDLSELTVFGPLEEVQTYIEIATLANQ